MVVEYAVCQVSERRYIILSKIGSGIEWEALPGRYTREEALRLYRKYTNKN